MDANRSEDASGAAQFGTRRIDLTDESEVWYWTTKFDISRERLRLAVEAAGPYASNVARWLRGE